MTRVRTTMGLALIVSLSLWAGSASAQNLDLDEIGALLALPVITDRGGTMTAITITNAGAEVRLRINVISGDPGDNWRSQDFDCDLTASETAQFVFRARRHRRSSVSYECDGFEMRRAPLRAANGIMVVTLEDPLTGATINTNQIFGDAVVLDSDGWAYSVGAIPFQGGVPSPGIRDRRYRFDNFEYAKFPSALATNFVAADDEGPGSSLILFTLDGTIGHPPEAQVNIMFYNDDEVPGSTSWSFDCFDIVSLLDIDGRFEASALGSPVGHMVLTPAPVTYTNVAHDSRFDGRFRSVDGVRTPPVHGWIFLTDTTAKMAWGRPLSQSQLSAVPSSGDVAVLNAPRWLTWWWFGRLFRRVHGGS